MSTSSAMQQRNEKRGDVLAVSLGASVIMWSVAYVGLSPAVNMPGILMAGFVVVALLLAGVVIGKYSRRGVRGGISVGLMLGLINFLIVASLHGRELEQAVRFGTKWVLGFTLVAVILAAVGSLIGARLRTEPLQPIRWTSWLASIVALTVLPLLISGGIVTGLEAGLAVPDWLTTFDYPMMFYPMAEMQRVPGVYAEHFHRLWGLLVGLAVILLAVQLHRVDPRRWLRWLSIVIILAVIVQGVLGAYWVLQGAEAVRIEAVAAAGEAATVEPPSRMMRYFAVGHGVFGQLVFSVIVAVAAFSSSTWLASRPAQLSERAATDRTASVTFFVLLVIQLALGALYRHLRRDAGDPGVAMHVLWTHIAFAMLVVVAGVFAAGRAWGFHREQPVLPRVGKAILHSMGLQVVLGFLALFAVLYRGTSEDIPLIEVIFTTAHQALGAVLLALAGLLVVWNRRLLQPVEEARAAA